MLFVTPLVRQSGIRVRTENLHLSPVELGSALINPSKATGLKDTFFRLTPQSVGSVTATFQIITPEHRDLRQISFGIPHDLTIAGPSADVRQIVGETIYRQWLGLDRLLTQLWESHSIRLKAVYMTRMGQDMRDDIGRLMPEITKRGILEFSVTEYK